MQNVWSHFPLPDRLILLRQTCSIRAWMTGALEVAANSVMLNGKADSRIGVI